MQETMNAMVENTREMGCKWNNLLETVQEIKQEEENNEQSKKADMATGTQVESIEDKIQKQKEQSPFEMDKHIKKIHNPLEGVDDQKAESFEDPNQNGRSQR